MHEDQPMHEGRIIEIIPAEGWKVQYSGSEEDESPEPVPLVCWALVEGREAGRTVIGMRQEDGVITEVWPGEIERFIPPGEVSSK